jgi:hypothetical protein
VLAHELQRGFGVPRLEEVVALPVPALQSKQALHLPGTLNAFGNRFQVHFLRESSDQPDHAAGGAVGLHLPHQRAVDLPPIPLGDCRRPRNDNDVVPVPKSSRITMRMRFA